MFRNSIIRYLVYACVAGAIFYGGKRLYNSLFTVSPTLGATASAPPPSTAPSGTDPVLLKKITELQEELNKRELKNRDEQILTLKKQVSDLQAELESEKKNPKTGPLFSLSIGEGEHKSKPSNAKAEAEEHQQIKLKDGLADRISIIRAEIHRLEVEERMKIASAWGLDEREAAKNFYKKKIDPLKIQMEELADEMSQLKAPRRR